MHADDAAHVAAVGTGLAAEAGRVGAELNRQVGALQCFVAVNVRDRNLGGGYQPEIVAFALEEVFLELRQLACTEKAGRVHHKRRQHLGVSMLPCVYIEHEVNERAFELRAHVPIEGKTRSGDLGGSFQVEDAKLGSEIPMRLRLEIKRARLADTADFDVIFGPFAFRHGFVRHVGDAAQQFVELSFECLDLFVERGDRSLRDAHALLARGGVGALALQLANLHRLGIGARLQLLHLGERRAAFAVEFAELFQSGDGSACGEALGDSIEVGAKVREIVHVESPC